MARRLIPLLDRVLVEKVAAPTKSAGGVLLPETKKVNEGTVVAVGPGRTTTSGELVPMPVKEGDKVMLPEFGGQPIKEGEREFLLYRSDDLLAVIKGE
ncbi:unnamed protein product [Pedinophyceae sp. YPF-701]|nr:unnamed protein product [Pedinophyceae sp. YPF-701]